MVSAKVKAASAANEGKSLRQVAALAMRDRDGTPEVCLVTTRTTGRWSLPKGWPMKGLKDHDAARIEAEQEAGVVGAARRKPLGTYVYWKRFDSHFGLVEVVVYALTVKRVLDTWREQAQRKVMWVPPHVAAVAVEEAGLASILTALAEAQTARSAEKAGAA